MFIRFEITAYGAFGFFRQYNKEIILIQPLKHDSYVFQYKICNLRSVSHCGSVNSSNK